MNVSSDHDLRSVLRLSDHQVSTGIALFYVFYIVFDLPSNLVLSKNCNPAIWMSRTVVMCGIICLGMVGMKAAWSF